jgi:hypothetical protein
VIRLVSGRLGCRSVHASIRSLAMDTHVQVNEKKWYRFADGEWVVKRISVDKFGKHFSMFLAKCSVAISRAGWRALNQATNCRCR